MAYLEINLYSEALGVSSEVRAILPEAARQAKVVYLLHGMSDDGSIWMRRSSIERYAQERDLAILMPDGGLGWYTDMARGLPYFTYITQELPSLCRRMFPTLSTRREDTFAAGLSMGGYGALKCALRAPEVFSRAISLSGAVDVAELVRSKDAPVGVDYWADVFGPAQAVRGSFNDLFCAAEQMKDSPLRPEIYLWCGLQDALYPMNVRLRDHLTALGYAVRYEESPGDHQWKYWDEKIADALDWLVASEEG